MVANNTCSDGFIKKCPIHGEPCGEGCHWYVEAKNPQGEDVSNCAMNMLAMSNYALMRFKQEEMKAEEGDSEYREGFKYGLRCIRQKKTKEECLGETDSCLHKGIEAAYE